MNLVFCTNSKYLKPTAVSMLSVIATNKSPITFYIIHSDLNEENKVFLKESIKNQIEFIEVPKDTFKNLPIYGRSKEAYYRLLIPSLLPRNLKRCLYLDGDTLVQGSIDDFYSQDFENNALVVTEDIGEIVHFHKDRHDILGIPKSYKYFNSGVLLFNLEWFRDFDMEKIYSWIKQNSDKLKFLDQDVLNANFYDKVKYVDGYSYDYLEILMSPLLPNDGFKKARVVHFLKKPWKYDYTGVNAQYWWKYGKEIYGKLTYYKFLIINSLYRKILNLLLIFVSIETLKKIKK